MKKPNVVLRKIRIYPPALYYRLEKWLKNMSLRGWHLVSRKYGILYMFEQGRREEKEYFVWDATATGEGKYSIEMRYPFLEKTYGVKKSKSKLNANTLATFGTIIEVDTKKIDIQTNIGYQELKSDRNRLYRQRFFRKVIILSCVLGLLSILLLVKRAYC